LYITVKEVLMLIQFIWTACWGSSI